MTIIARSNLPPHPAQLGSQATNAERQIVGGAVFSLIEAQQHIALVGPDGINFATDKATEDLTLKLKWRTADVCNFIGALGSHRYDGSQWCYGTGVPKIPYPCDVYIMGFNRLTRTERQTSEPPWVYLKFGYSVDYKTIEIFSVHPADELLK